MNPGHLCTLIGFLFVSSANCHDVDDTEIEIIEEMHECLYAHNLLRDIHDTPHLDWDYDLEEAAQKWAVHLALTDSFTHADGNFGENIWMIGPTNQPGACSSAISDWYDEIKNYNYKNPGYDSETGHFSQLIWDTTKKLGVGVAYVPSSKRTYIVARYYPAGNAMDYKVHVHAPEENHIPNTNELVPPDGHQFYRLQDLWFQSGFTPCKDMDSGCSSMKTYCTDSMYKNWMKDQCYRTCGYCNANSPMPIDGGFSEWTSSVCSKSCGGGVLTKTRVCNNPKPKYQGMPCIGPSKISKSCNTHPCQAAYSADCEKQNVEDDDQCEKQAAAGRCQGTYQAWMEMNCYASCFCKNESRCPYEDAKDECKKQAENGSCVTYRDWMLKYCFASCCCDVGKDVKDDCEDQAKAGSCETYAPYMTKYCYASCFCDKVQ